MEKIETRHREAAAARIAGNTDKDVAVRACILAGAADDHPLVQAAAFYEGR